MRLCVDGMAKRDGEYFLHEFTAQGVKVLIPFSFRWLQEGSKDMAGRLHDMHSIHNLFIHIPFTSVVDTYDSILLLLKVDLLPTSYFTSGFLLSRTYA